jgi:threonine synthase
LLELRRLGRDLGLGRLWAKLEYQSPTGSFKDRGSSVLVSVALEHGLGEFVEDSSGNTGASLAAYAAAAGIVAHVFAPASASRTKLDQIGIYGAHLHVIPGPRQAAADAAQTFAKTRGLTYLSHGHSPFFLEGTKLFSYEVAASEASGVEHIVLPVGSGSLLIGTRCGFEELIASGVIGVLPRLHCVQAAAIRPITAAFRGEEWVFDADARTVASGISVSKPPRIEQALSAIRSSGGTAVTVTDPDILEWQRRLAQTEGIFCEVTSAAAFAGLAALIESGTIEPGAQVLMPVTGSGLKEPLKPLT